MNMDMLLGDCLDVLPTLEAGSVQTCITSPPYWGLRSYLPEGHEDKPAELGLEATPEEYVAKMVEVFRAVKRVLRDDGCLFLNLGDSYACSPAGNKTAKRQIGNAIMKQETADALLAGARKDKSKLSGLKPKDLVGMPWAVAFALRADGWYLRSDIIWAKKNPMPESCTDRPTKAHEYVFLLTKSAKYFYDADAIREPNSTIGDAREGNGRHTYSGKCDGNTGTQQSAVTINPAGRNKRSVWTIATQPYAKAHFATFPEALVLPCILAGTSEEGCCAECGAPWERVVERDISGCETEWSTVRDVRNTEEIAAFLRESRERVGMSRNAVDEALGTRTLYSWFEGRPAGIETPTVEQWQKLKIILDMDSRHDDDVARTKRVEVTNRKPQRAEMVAPSENKMLPARTTTGWQPTCTCDAETVPCTVCDIFLGSGTVAKVAQQYGRSFVGCELSPEYLELARDRFKQSRLFT